MLGPLKTFSSTPEEEIRNHQPRVSKKLKYARGQRFTSTVERGYETKTNLRSEKLSDRDANLVFSFLDTTKIEEEKTTC